jgi:hypothetical protein
VRLESTQRLEALGGGSFEEVVRPPLGNCSINTHISPETRRGDGMAQARHSSKGSGPGLADKGVTPWSRLSEQFQCRTWIY